MHFLTCKANLQLSVWNFWWELTYNAMKNKINMNNRLCPLILVLKPRKSEKQPGLYKNTHDLV